MVDGGCFSPFLLFSFSPFLLFTFSAAIYNICHTSKFTLDFWPLALHPSLGRVHCETVDGDGLSDLLGRWRMKLFNSFDTVLCDGRCKCLWCSFRGEII